MTEVATSPGFRASRVMASRAAVNLILSPPISRNALTQNVFDFMSRPCRNAGRAVLRGLQGQNPGDSKPAFKPGHPVGAFELGRG